MPTKPTKQDQLLRELPRGPGRPRDAASTAAILDATLVLLAERGYHAVSLDDIANLAISSKTTMYRRWSSKPQLVADAVRYALTRANPVAPKTESVHADVRTLLRNTARALQQTSLGGALRALVATAETDDVLAACLTEVEQERRELLRSILQRGQACREIGRDRDCELEIDLLLGTLYFRWLIRRLPVTAQFLDALVTRLLP